LVSEKRVLKGLWIWTICSHRRAGPYGASWVVEGSLLKRSEEQRKEYI
jgi:hypothetical protein